MRYFRMLVKLGYKEIEVSSFSVADRLRLYTKARADTRRSA